MSPGSDGTPGPVSPGSNAAPGSEVPAVTLDGCLELVIMQATPFCNIDCKYCYLPDRLSTDRMSPETAARAIRRVLESRFAGKSLTLVWHAGEPLVPGVPYYRKVFAAIDEACSEWQQSSRRDVEIEHSFQTNGLLINEEWCRFFAESPHVRVGISLDGPARLHDLHRRTRDDKPTHAGVM